jgi:FkbM family methyltransferase
MDFFSDYAARLRSVATGFTFLGLRWAPGAAAYLAHPILRHIAPGRLIQAGGYRARIGESDLYVLGNLFRDYDVCLIKRVLPDIEQVIDAGANVGAFSFLITHLDPEMNIIAIEPNAGNFSVLRSQPFAERLDCRNAALGPHEGQCRLITGPNSATHHTEALSDDDSDASIVPMLALSSFPARKTLLKLDVEGAELAILEQGLPSWIQALVMEWHHPGTPERFFPNGILKKYAFDVHGSTCWCWRRV